MKLHEYPMDDRLLIRAEGRLDASWAEHVKETLLAHVRAGRHHIVLDAAGISYLSSMGIRSLMVLYKELSAVHGSFAIIQAQGMVRDTLEKSGLGQWLSDEVIEPDGMQSEAPPREARDADPVGEFVLDAGARLRLERVDAWTPWQAVAPGASRKVRFEKGTFALGIGGAGEDYVEARSQFGEFVAVNGHVAMQPPDERSRPDCLLSERDFTPTLECITALVCRGAFSHQLRFRNTNTQPSFPISSLLENAFHACGSATVAFVIVGEIEGLVGAFIIRSPGDIEDGMALDYPEVKNWLRFSGERVFPKEQAVIAGVARRTSGAERSRGLTPLPSAPEMAAHMHAAVFPYQFIPNGQIALEETIDRFFGGPPPKAVMNLLDDRRPGNGLGESALYGGCMWCGAVEDTEALR